MPRSGTTAIVLVADASALSIARSETERVVAEVDRACSRFRDDSDLVRVNAHPNEEVVVSLWLLDALDVAMHGARATGGLVDPTVGAAVREIGYDRDFAQLDPDGPTLDIRVRRVPGWRRVDMDRVRRTVRVPKGVELDLGATGKAWCADRAATRPRGALTAVFSWDSGAISRARAKRPKVAGGCGSPTITVRRSTRPARR